MSEPPTTDASQEPTQQWEPPTDHPQPVFEHAFQHSREWSPEELERSKQARIRFTMRMTNTSVARLAKLLGLKTSTLAGRIYGKYEPMDSFYQQAMVAMGRHDGTLPQRQAPRSRIKANPWMFLSTTANHLQDIIEKRAVPQLRAAALYKPVNFQDWSVVHYRVERMRKLAAELLAMCDEALAAINQKDPRKTNTEVAP